jgi:hypothetical protein
MAMNRRQFSLKFLFIVTAVVAITCAIPGVALLELTLAGLLLSLLIPAIIALGIGFALTAIGMFLLRRVEKRLAANGKVSAANSAAASAVQADDLAEGRSGGKVQNSNAG